MADLIVRYPTIFDIAHVGGNMRPADAAEVWASSRSEPLTAVAESVALSDLCWAAEVDGDVVALFGAAPLLGLIGRTAAPWMLGTPALDHNSVLLMKTCRGYIAQMRERYPHLLNYVDARNSRSIRWLKRLGFVVHPAEPYGPDGYPFHKFEMR